MNSLFAIHKLHDRQIHRVAGQNIRRIAIETLFLHQKVEHLFEGDAGGHLQVFVKTLRDEVSGGFGPRPARVYVLAHGELQGSPQSPFHRGDTYVAVSLAPVPVPHRKQGAARVDRQAESRSRHQVLVTVAASRENRNFESVQRKVAPELMVRESAKALAQSRAPAERSTDPFRSEIDGSLS